GHGTDMVFMRVGQDNTQKIVEALLDELGIGEDQLCPRVFGRPEAHAEINHQPLPAAAVEIDVHADLARAAKGEKQQFVFRIEVLLHRADARSARMARPLRVRSMSTASNISVCLSNNSARPPVAMTWAGRPISARRRSIRPSIIAT